MMVTSDFRTEVEIQLFGACTMKNVPSLWPNRQNFCILQEIGVRGPGTQRWHQILDRKWKYGHFLHVKCIRP